MQMDFSNALRAVKGGYRIARAGWNGKGMWLKLFDPSHLPDVALERAVREEDCPTMLPFIVMKVAGVNQMVPWLASQTDILADDWEML